MLYKNTEALVRSPNGDTDFFDMVTGVLQGDTLVPYLFTLGRDYVHRNSTDLIKENCFTFEKKTVDMPQRLWQMQTTQMI